MGWRLYNPVGCWYEFLSSFFFFFAEIPLLLYIMVTRAATQAAVTPTVVTEVCKMSICANCSVLKLKSENIMKQLMHYHTRRFLTLTCDWLVDPFSSRCRNQSYLLQVSALHLDW